MLMSERSWEKYRANQERMRRIGSKRRRDKGDTLLSIIATVILIGIFIAFLRFKGYI
jgi:hypothetical protein